MYEYKLVFRPLEGIVTKHILETPGPSKLPFWKKLLDTLSFGGYYDDDAGLIGCSVEDLEFKYQNFLKGAKPNDFSYSNNDMPYHVGLVVGDKLFEYEDDEMFYKGYKDYKVNYNKKISWQDLCPDSTDPKIRGKTKTSPDRLNTLIMNHGDSSWRTRGNYKLLTHNCQHFTHFAISLLE
ncbi:hypothetical protein M9Y10_004042 [Tritrichomonas musculus]|uniref:PPPDE domain-containing protein n=1 Tax=Tritrichomonas musculus TaxID=1915356 RepID=A0ABR2JRE4_9EUKA